MNTIFNRVRWIIGAAMLTGALGLGVFGISTASMDGEYDGGEYHDGDDERRAGTLAPQMDLYLEECGACHIAYPAPLLPSAGWREIMNNLDDHFGDNAALDEPMRTQIAEYLERYGANARGSRFERRMFRGLDNASPIRITSLPYFVHEHDEIPRRFVAGNDRVGSFSRCDACHADAQRGRFDEDTVVIPGLGRWDD